MKKCTTHHYACDCREEKFLDSLEHILNEVHCCPDDSVTDIANEVLMDIGLLAEWEDGSPYSTIIIQKKETTE